MSQAETQTTSTVPSETGTFHTGTSAADLFKSLEPGSARLNENPAVSEAATAPESVPEKIEEKKADPLSAKYAALAREERRVQLERNKLKEESKGLPEFLQAKKNARMDPLAYIKASGIEPQEFYDNLTQVILEGKVPKDAHVRELETKLEKIEREQLEREEANAKAEKERARQSAQRQVADTIISAGEEFELINSFKRHDLVCNEIVNHYKATGEDLPIKEAAQKVEIYLETQAEIFTNTNRFKSKYARAAETLAPALATPPDARGSKTLTNSASTGTTEPQRVKTREEEIEWAKKMLTK